MTLEIRSSTQSVTYQRTTDAFGSDFRYFDAIPAGTYSITVTAGTQIVSVIVRKS